MRFRDTLTDDIYTLQPLHRDWARFRTECPGEYPPSFQIELLGILFACVKGRNNLEVIGMTPKEVDHFIIRLQKKLSNQE